MFNLITTAYAESGSTATGGGMSSLLMIVVMLAIFYFLLTRLPTNAASAQLAYTHTGCMEGDSTPFTISKAPSMIHTRSIITEVASPIHVCFPNTVLRDIFTYPRSFFGIYSTAAAFMAVHFSAQAKKPRPDKMPDRGLLHAFLGIIPRSL